MGRAAANSPEQAGRNALYKYLDDIADKDTAERRAAVPRGSEVPSSTFTATP